MPSLFRSRPHDLAHLTGTLRHVASTLLRIPDILRLYPLLLVVDAGALVMSAILLPSVAETLPDLAIRFRPATVQLSLLATVLRCRTCTLSLLPVLFIGHW